MAVYNLVDKAKNITWKEWRKMGGCGLSGLATVESSKSLNLPISKWDKQGITLRDISCASKLAEREVARFMRDHLSMPLLTITEYE